MKIAAKEADETVYWLKICKNLKSYSCSDYIADQLIDIIKIISKIISSSKKS
jgi:four helix bundle protein